MCWYRFVLDIMTSKTTEVLDILSDRHQFLRLLAEESLSQQQIIEQTQASQSTISRTLSQLQDLGIVSETDNRYELTLLGGLVHQNYEACVTEIEQLYSAEEILRDLSAGIPLDPVVLEGSEITISKPHVPDAALSPLLQLTREATEIKAAATMVHVGYIDTFHEQMKHSNLEAEFILIDAVAEHSTEMYSDRDTTMLQTERLELYKTAADLPYSLVLIQTADEVYTVIAVGSETGMHGSIVNTTDAAYEWAQDRYRQFKSNADRWIPPSER